MSHPNRRDTIRHLSHPQRLRESLSLSGPFFHRNSFLSGLQVAITSAIVLPLMLNSSRPDLLGYAALGALIALFGRFAPRGKRAGVLLWCLLCQVAMVFFVSLAGWAGATLGWQLALMAPLTALIALVASALSFGPPGALIFLFAGAASLGPVAELSLVFERIAAVAAVGAFAWLLCLATEGLRIYTVLLPEPPPLRLQAWLALRLGFCAGLTALLGYALGLSHPAWAAMGAVAVMQSAQLHQSLARMLQRVGGNVIGASLAWGVLVLDPSPYIVIALLILCMVLNELLIGANYGLGQILVTPMALLMTYLALQGTAGAAIAPERMLDTLVGCASGLMLAVLLSTKGERQFLMEHHNRSLGG